MPAVTADSVVVELEARTQNFTRDMDQAAAQFQSQMDRIAGAATRAENQINASSKGIRDALVSLAEGIGLSVTLEQLQSLTDEWTRYTNALKVVGLEGERLTVTQQALLDVADKNGIELENVGNLYRQVSLVGKSLNLTQEDGVKITEAFSAAVRIQGASSRTASYATLELAHAFDEGRVMARQFNALAMEMPVLLQAVAQHIDGAKGSIGELRKEVIAGNVSSEQFAKALIASSEELEAQAQRTQLTIGASYTVLRNNLVAYIGQAAQTSGANKAVSDGILALANNLDRIGPALAVVGGLMAGRYVAGAVAARTGMIGATIAQTEFIAQVLLGQRAIDETAEAHARLTSQIALEARSEQEAAAANVEAIQAQIAALTEEAAAYENNIRLAAEQRAAANAAAAEARTIAAANARAGFGNVIVGAGAVSAPGAAQTGTEAAEADALGAQLATKQALTRVNAELSASEGALGAAMAQEAAASAAASAAGAAANAAVKETSMVAQLATVAMGGLEAAFSFFGGPIGVAIIAIVIALTSLSDEARRTEEAVGNAGNALDDLHKRAEEAANSTKKSGDAADVAAGQYTTMAQAARDAALAIRDMDAAQRQSYKDELAKKAADLDEAISGNDVHVFGLKVPVPFTTNLQERVANARQGALSAFGVNSLGGNAFSDQTDEVLRNARLQAQAGQATQKQIAALQKLNDAEAVLQSAVAHRAALTSAVNAITVGAKVPVGNGAAPEVVVHGKTRQQLLDDEQYQVQLAQASGDKAALRAAQERVYITQKTNEYLKHGLSENDAYNKAVSEAAQLRKAQTASDARAAAKRGAAAGARADNAEIQTERAVQKADTQSSQAAQQEAEARVKAAEQAIAILGSDTTLSDETRAAGLKILTARLQQYEAASAGLVIERDRIRQQAEAAASEAQLNPRWSQAQKDRVIAAINSAADAELAATIQKEITATLTEQAKAELTLAQARLTLAQIAVQEAATGRGNAATAGKDLSGLIARQDTTGNQVATIEAERAGYSSGIDANTRSPSNPSGTYSPDEAARLKAAKDEAAAAQTQAVLMQQRVLRAQNQLAVDQQISTYEQDQLQITAALATSTKDRREAELKLLELQQTEAQAKLETILAQNGVTEATKERARAELAAVQALQKTQVNQQNEGPLASYIRTDLTKTPAALNDDFQNVAVNGLKSLNDGLAQALTGTESLGTAFKNTGQMIEQALYGIFLREMIIAPLAKILFGSGTGGGGGFLSSLMNGFFSAVFGGGGVTSPFSGPGYSDVVGPASLGSASTAGLPSFGFAGATGITATPGMGLIRVNEHGQEGFMPDVPGKIIPNRQMLGMQSTSPNGTGAHEPEIHIHNNTGVPAKADAKREENGDLKVMLEPIMKEGVKGMAASGFLAKQLQTKTPPAKKRG